MISIDKFNAFLTIIAYIFAAGASISLLSVLFSIGYYTKTEDGKREAEILRILGKRIKYRSMLPELVVLSICLAWILS